MLLASVIGPATVLAEDMKLPPLQKQSTPQAVINEHFDALNKCDWNRIMAQYPPDYQLHLPDGVVVKGREKAGELFANFVKPHDRAPTGFGIIPSIDDAVVGIITVLLICPL